MSSARDEALAAIAEDPRLGVLYERSRALCDPTDPGHDVEHHLRVAGWTLRCASNDVDRVEAVAAALLHDVVNVPKDDPARASASAQSAATARVELIAVGFGAHAIERMARAIEDHSYSRGQAPRSALGDALQDADRLEALGAIGLMRTFSTGAKMGAKYFCASDPFAEARELDDRRYTLDHFERKLLRLAETMRTPRGREEAERRTALMRAFVDAVALEL
ncbi:MAG: HD domain-containing protein [Sandaracinaceae bacterium]